MQLKDMKIREEHIRAEQPKELRRVLKEMVRRSLAAVKEKGTEQLMQTAQNGLNNTVPFPVSWTVKMKKKQKETQDILSYHTQAAGCSDKARAKASGGRQPIEECGRTGL